MTESWKRKGDTVGKAGKILAGILTAALVTGAAAGGLSYIKRSNVKTATVIKVSSLADSYYYDDTQLEGTVTSNVTQEISVDKDVIIDEVLVKKGDNVKKGDKLIRFDTTLVGMELNIARLKRQKQEQDLNTAVWKIRRVENGETLSDSELFGTSSYYSDYTDDTTDSPDSFDLMSRLTKGSSLTAVAFPHVVLAEILDDEGDASDPVVTGEVTGNTPGSTELPAMGDMLSSDIVSGPGEELSSGPEWGQQQTIIEGQDASGSVSPEGGYTGPTPTPVTVDPADTGGLTDGDEEFYLELNYQSEPFTGTGTMEDPFVFLCSGAKGQVRVLGSFFNKMAGRSEDGSKILKEGGYWFALEFYPLDSIGDYSDRKESCSGYYYLNGGLFTEPLNPFAETFFTVSEAKKYEKLGPTPSAGASGSYGYYGNSSSVSRAEAMKILQMRASSLELDLKESDIKISKLEKKNSITEVVCRIDGIVEFVGDPDTGTSSDKAFMKVRSADGFYLKGRVGELMLDQINPGTQLKCTSYMTGNFEASVVDVSTYPVDASDSFFGYSASNPNVSYYSFTAEIEDQTLPFTDQDYVTITVEKQNDRQNGLIISKAFVRSENGAYYVMKDDNGVLKKQYVKSGGTVNGGYSIRITAGITRNDKIAFPYGDTSKEGLPTKDGTLDELYGYY